MKRIDLAQLGALDRAELERGRAFDPIVRAQDLSHVVWGKSDLAHAERFFGDFGLFAAVRSEDAVYLRGAGPAHHLVVLRRAAAPCLLAIALRVGSELDLRRLASLPGSSEVEPTGEPGGGLRVRLETPGGLAVEAVHGIAASAPLPQRAPILHNFAYQKTRVGATQRPPCAPPDVARLGHVALESTHHARDLLWWLRTFGLIVSDYQHLEEAPSLGPVMAFMRCDRGSEPADHHTVALAASLSDGLAHAAFEVQDLDAVAMGGEYLRRRGWRRAWGVGRHILGSQIFDYWRDPDGVMVEHFADGDVFDAAAPTGELAFRGSHLAQWGPPLPADFVGARPGPRMLARLAKGLVTNRELRLRKLAATARALAR